MIDRIKNKIELLRKLCRKKLEFFRIQQSISCIKTQSGNIGNEEPVVLCLLQNGSYFIESFMQHYLHMGFKNFVFIDNGSTDNSIELLKKYNVTILLSPLPYSRYKWLFKQYLVEKYAPNRWSLYVDIDELWDYPYSSKIKLSQFISYLDSHKYTAVAAYMADMFADEPLNNLAKFKNTPLREAYPYLDNSCVKQTPYKKAYNKIANPEIKDYRGGIHQQFFGISDIYLSKIPFVKWNPTISVHETSHTSTFVHIADVTTILLHYKFVWGFYEKAKAIMEKGHYYQGGKTYKMYLDVLQHSPDLNLKTQSAKKYTSCEDLQSDGVIVIGNLFEEFVQRNSNNI